MNHSRPGSSEQGWSGARRVVALILLLAGCGITLQAQSPACANSTLTGTYFYLLTGSLISGTQHLPYAELGILVANGQGSVAGESNASVNGTLGTYTLTGTYAVQANCRGNMTLAGTSSGTASFNFEVVNGGQGALVSFSSPGGVAVGRAYKATTGSTQCGIGSLTGSYGFLVSGLSGTALFSQEGQVVANGNGSLTMNSVVNSNGAVTQPSGVGTYSLASSCAGTAIVTSQNVSSHFLFTLVQDGQTALFLEIDPGTTVSGISQSQALVATVLPDFGFGGGFYSAMYFTNTGNSAVSFPVNFVGDDGNPLTVPSAGGSSTNINLALQGTAVFEAPNVGPLTQGYATVVLPTGVVGYGIFRKSAAGVPDQEVIVPFSSAAATRNTLTWDDTNFVTAVSIVNPSPIATVVTINVRDNANNLIGTPTLPLPANSKTAVVMRDIPGLTGMAGKFGSADFTVSAGNIAVLGLRFSGSVFTSIPTVGR